MTAVCRFDELPDGAARRVDVNGDAVALVRIGNEVYALSDTCSHANVSLSGGEVWCDELELECPKHGSAFNLETGLPNTLPATQPVAVYAASVADGDVVVVPSTVEAGRPAVSTLDIRGLTAKVAGKEILKGVDLTVSSGEVHAVMGPNGAGKSTLSAVVMGKPGYEVTGGSVTLDGVDVLSLPTWERATAGLHLVMQYPTEVPGVLLDDVLVEALSTRGADTSDVDTRLRTEADAIGFEERFLHRPLNVDLSGGEKKRNETLQLAMLRPKVAILDELDSGLDIDALRDCARRVEAMSNETDCDPLGVLAITHYSRLLDELEPDQVHILADGRIAASGGPELAAELETDGYAAFAPAADDETDASSSALSDLFSL